LFCSAISSHWFKSAWTILYSCILNTYSFLKLFYNKLALCNVMLKFSYEKDNFNSSTYNISTTL
jgi:hypothetical protein